jgi:signal transduction histidine kinase
MPLLVILVFGAGRRYGQPKDVYFVLPGKVFLDLGLCVLVGWVVLVLTIADELSRPLFREINSHTMTLANIMFAVVCVLLLTPVLFWILSLAKSLKAGKLWKRMLILALPVWIFKTVIRFARSLWVGAALMVKVSIIAIVTFLALIFVVWVSLFDTVVGLVIIAPGITVASAILLFRYAKRIKTLEQGAEVVCGGKYNEAIVVGGGELGNIAASINNIGEGIHNAVEQRMKSERLKTELITNVSHDIRTPLTSIITYTDLLKHEGLDCEKAPEYLDVLIQKSQRLKMLTDELFEAAKAAAGNIEVNITDMDMVSLINQVMGEMDSSINSSGLDIRFNHPEHLNVKGDGRLMWRVMENLLSNALKYALSGSRVYLDVSEAQAPYSCISIKNISAQELNVNPSELTERFKRGDASRTEGGNGLGLSIVQSFVEAQSGKFDITIDGDLFKATIWLPVV